MTDELFNHTLDVAATITRTAMESTSKSAVGILAVVMAASALAKSQNWTREEFEEAWQAATRAVYDAPDKPALLI